VFALLKWGYFTLQRLKTKEVVRDGKTLSALIVGLKRSDTFEQLYKAFIEDARERYKDKIEAAVASSTEEPKAEACEEAKDSLPESVENATKSTPSSTEEVTADERQLDSKGKWWLKGIPSE
jgi:hypothetical protein